MPYICAMQHFPKRLQDRLKDREATDSLRFLRLEEDKVDFCSNDYLGFAGNQQLNQEVYEYLKEKEISGNGASGSRLLSGNTRLCEDVEDFLANYYGADAALLFNSGYDANLGFFASLPQKGDLILYDEYIHASIRDGIQLSFAKSLKFRHNDLGDLEKKLMRTCQTVGENERQNIYVVTESVFSMDGDTPDLKAFARICEAYGVYLIVDEAHAVGLYGEKGTGLIVQESLQDKIFARVITFGKAFGVHGAAILGSRTLIQYLLNFARRFIYSTALPPHSLAAIYKAHQFMSSGYGQEQRTSLNYNIRFFREEVRRSGLNELFVESDAAIQSCILPDNKRVKQAAQAIQQAGFDVRPILAPTVPAGKERIRFCLHSFNKKEDIDAVLKQLFALWKRR